MTSLDTTRRLRSRTIVVAVVGLAFVGLAHVVRVRLGLAPSVEAVQSWADGLGWQGPLAFVGLVAIRQLLLLPAVVLLTAGGLVFGGALGAALGGTGIVCSALINFALARRIGPTMLPETLSERVRRLSAGSELPLLVTIAAVTAHPIGPMVLVQWVAGTSTIAPWRFFSAIAPTSYFRAGTLAVFGASLPAWGSPASILSTASLLVLIALPFAFASVRRRLL